MTDPIIVTKQFIKETYDTVAASYDETDWFFEECGQRLVDLLAIKPDANVLDVATGTGKVLVPAARRAGPGGHVTGIDISDVMLQQAQKTAQINGLTNIDLQKMDAEHLEFPDAFFDAITCGFAVWFLPPGAIDEMYRVCKPGGFIGVTVFDSTVAETRRRSEMVTELTKEYGIEFKGSYQMRLAPGEAEALLAKHGFNHKQTFQETKEKVYKNVKENWESFMSHNVRKAVADMDGQTRARFIDELSNRLKPFMQPDGLHRLMYIIYSVAQKSRV